MNCMRWEKDQKKMPDEISDEIRKESDSGLKFAAEQKHILIPVKYTGSLRAVLEKYSPIKKDISPFFLPAGGVRQIKDIPVGFAYMLREAEKRAGQKWREREIRWISENDPAKEQKIWGGFTDKQKRIIKQSAWEKLSIEEQCDYVTADNISEGKAFLLGMPGLNKNIVMLEEISPDKVSVVASPVRVNVLKYEGSFEETQTQNSNKIRANIERFFKRSLKGKRKIYTQEIRDDYTVYNFYIFEDLLKEIFSLIPEEIKILSPEQRVFMIRGPPTDFYIVIVNEDATVKILNIDSMFHAENLPQELREKVRTELKEGLGGRDTDYIVFNMKDKSKLKKLIKLDPTENELSKILREKGARVFPFKAGNSYAAHDIVDNYILAASIEIYKAFLDEAKKSSGIDAEGIKRAVRTAGEKINSAIDEQKFKKVTVSRENPNGKEPIAVMLQAHVVSQKIDNIRDAENKAAQSIRSLEAMSSVRSSLVILADGEIVGDYAGCVRTYIPENGEQYKKAYSAMEGYARLASETELEIKNGLFKEEALKLRSELKNKKAQKKVEEIYSLSGGVISNLANAQSPLVVALPCSFTALDDKAYIAQKVRRQLEEKYGTKNIHVISYENKDDLAKKKSQIQNILNLNEKAAAVIFCDSRSGIHPEGNMQKDIFKDLCAPDTGEAKVYYVNEDYKESRSVEPLIGPHVALAMGIKQVKAGQGNPELIAAMSRLIVELSGNDSNIIDKLSTVQGFNDFLKALLNGQMLLPIQRIDLDEIRDRIRAEEKALISL
ncbi:MAG: hypothetical protein ABH869_02290 [Candidatus Omnitrophota bacterium]